MRIHFLLLAAAATVMGCAQAAPIGLTRVLRPGRDMLLVYHCEMQMAGVSGMEERLVAWPTEGGERRSTVTKRQDTPYTSTEWAELELPLRVGTLSDSSRLCVRMTVRRFRGGNSYAEQGKEKREESVDSKWLHSAASACETHSEVRDAEFIAIVDVRGRLVSSDVVGKYWSERKQELAESVKQGGSQEQADMALRWQTAGIFSALEDAMAYLPPEGARRGDSWKVRRKHVLPYHAYGFYMLTNGCSHSEETSTCRVKSLRFRGPDWIAVIAIAGERIPHDPAPSMPRRVQRLELAGELTVNLSTGAIEKLQLESIPKWVRSNQEPFEVRLAHRVTLKPM